MKQREGLKTLRRIVIKVGSSVLLKAGGGFSPEFFRSLARQIAPLINNKYKILLVSSGAIAAGMERLKIPKKPHGITKRQALAACGQTALMHMYEKVFSRFGIRVAQILLDREDLAHRRRYLNARQAIFELWNMGVLPILNENDTVAVDEIQFGDNDNLAGLVVSLVEAELLILLTDIDGLHTADPRTLKGSERLSLITELDEKILKLAAKTKGERSVGGMITKLEAAEKAARYGAATVIAKGSGSRFLSHVLEGKDVGTLLLPKPKSGRLKVKKHWMAYTLSPKGTLLVDVGARKALAEDGKSLLPSGIKKVEGIFERGDCVFIRLDGEKAFAKGLVSYSTKEMEQIKGAKTAEVEQILGYKYSDEVIHRDDLVLL